MLNGDLTYELIGDPSCSHRQGNLQELALSYQQKSFPDIRHSPLLPLNITCLIATFNMAAQTTEKLDQLDRKIPKFSACFSV